MPPRARQCSPQTVLAWLQSRHEVAMVDVREHEEYVRMHPLPAVHLAADRIELDARSRLPRAGCPIVVAGGDEDTSAVAASRLHDLGYTNLWRLEGGVRGWENAGLPMLEDVNAISKAFGEHVEAVCRTPEMPIPTLAQRLSAGEGLAVIDCRPAREHEQGHIPGAVHAPGDQLVRRLPELVPDQNMPVVVHCGGRTRGIIGAQSLRNAGVPNEVSVLENGAMGWHLAGLALQSGTTAGAPATTSGTPERLAQTSERVARRFGVRLLDAADFERLRSQRGEHSLYRFELGTPEETANPVPGFRLAPGVQLVQATDEFVGTHNARVVLTARETIDAVLTASWLKQMGWRETAVLPYRLALAAADHLAADERNDSSGAEDGDGLSVQQVAEGIAAGRLEILDLSSSHHYLRGHIPGAAFARRDRLAAALSALPPGRTAVLVSEDGRLAALAARQLLGSAYAPVEPLRGGMRDWNAADGELETGPGRLLSTTTWLNEALQQAWQSHATRLCRFIDWELERFVETDTSLQLEDAMRAYLQWEIDLVDRWSLGGMLQFSAG